VCWMSSISPVTKSRAIIPLALPSITTKSCISRVYDLIFPRPDGSLQNRHLVIIVVLFVLWHKSSCYQSPPKNGYQVVHRLRANGTPCITHWSMIFTETSASLCTLASLER
jgi:hypothetical protein